MEANGDIPERLATLEQEVAELKRKVQTRDGEGGNDDWPDCLFGSMVDFPEWGEISRMGKEIGNAQGDYMDDYVD